MNKLRPILILVAVLLLGVWAYKLSTKAPDNSKLSSEALKDFAVNDTAAVDKIVMTDTEGNKGVTLFRNEDKSWSSETFDCIQQHLVETILMTFKNIKVKSPVPKNGIETVNKNLTTHHKKVEIFQKGELVKTWYVGQPTPDQYGTYMLLKDPEKGKSPEPFIMYLPNMFGNLETRFITNPLEFECTGVFNYDVANIKSIEVQTPDTAQYNFKIDVIDDNLFSLTSNGEEVDKFDTSNVRAYLLNFRKIHFEQHNYLTDNEAGDSIKSQTPWFIFKVTDNKGDVNEVRTFKKHMMFEKYDYDGNLIEWDRDRLWVQLRDGRLVVGQFHVFDKILYDLRLFDRREEPTF